MTFTILGGGISGLCASLYLRRLGYKGNIVLIESSERLGGWINTYQTQDKTHFELGPRTLRATGNAGYNTLNLADTLGLRDKIIPVLRSHPSSKNRLIKVNGKLHKLPNSFKDSLKKFPPFSKPLILSVLNDLRSPKVFSTDESMYSFVYRRFGPEIANYIVDPLCRGVFAGNAKDLSINALAKYIYNCEQMYGSVIKGLILNRKNAEKFDNSLNSSLVMQAKSDKWSVWSLMGGLQTLITALEHQIVNKCDVEIIKNTKIENISYSKEFILKSKEAEYTANKVISCIPAFRLKTALKYLNNDLYNLLGDIPFVSVAVVNLEYSDEIIKEPAFGYLVPSSEKCKVLGVIFDHVTFPQGGKTILTVMIGGYWFKELLGSSPSEEQILDIAVEEIKSTFNVSMAPKAFKVNILNNCIPQYTVGHFERVENMRKLIADLRIPIGLAGNSYDGVGVNDAIYCSKKVVESML